MAVARIIILVALGIAPIVAVLVAAAVALIVLVAVARVLLLVSLLVARLIPLAIAVARCLGALALGIRLLAHSGLSIARLALAIALETVLHVVVGIIVAVAILLGLRLLQIGLGGRQEPQIVFGKLIIAFGHHAVAGGLGIAAELEIFVGDGLRRAADFHIGTIALINPVYGVAAAVVSPAPTAGVTPGPAPATLAVMLP